jgi:GNAT superfamily N-acetyltransferase
MIGSVDLARRVERTEAEFCALAGGAGLPSGVRALSLAGGRAMYAVPGSPLNKVLGLGVGETVDDAALDAIIGFYQKYGSPAQIELCPLADSTLLPRLLARGFAPVAFENELALELSSLRARTMATSPAIRVDARADLDAWVEVVADGFAVADAATTRAGDVRAGDALKQIMRQFAHPAIRRYLAWIDGQPAGGGAAYVHDGVLGIFGTATLPRFRRRGVQAALVAHALSAAGDEVDLAIATTEPGSLSQRTFERAGFHVLYTRLILVKAAAAGGAD